MKERLIIEKFEAKKGLKEVKTAKDLAHLNDLQKLQLVVGYLFGKCMEVNGNMSYGWRNDKNETVAHCYVFVGEQATEIQKLVEEYNKKEADLAKDKQSIANEHEDPDNLYYIQTTMSMDDLDPPSKSNLFEKVTQWIGENWVG